MQTTLIGTLEVMLPHLKNETRRLDKNRLLKMVRKINKFVKYWIEELIPLGD